MSGHWGRIERATGRSPAPAPRRSSGAPPVLSLQRAVGNRATGRLLQRRPKWVGLSLGTNNSKQEVKIKREIGTRGGYDNRLQAIAAARLAGADPAAVASATTRSGMPSS